MLRECRKHYRNDQDLCTAPYPDRQQKSHMAFKWLADRFYRFGTVKQTRVKRRPIVNERRMSLHQDLYGNNFLKRVHFSNWIHRKMRTDVSFLSHVLFSDEANFANTGNVKTCPWMFTWTCGCNTTVHHPIMLCVPDKWWIKFLMKSELDEADL